MILLSHPTGNINASATARGLHRNQLLASYYTCVSWNPNSLLAKGLPRSVTRWLNRRQQVSIPPQLIKTRPFREIVRNVCELTRIHSRNVKENWPFSTEQVYYDLDRHIASQMAQYSNLRGVYAYDDGALEQFRHAEKIGLKRIYDLPIGHWRALQKISLEESEAQPEWAGTMKALTDTEEKIARKDEEIERADLIVVASTFSKKTLELFPKAKKTVVVPYGMPAISAGPRPLTNSASPLRVLFVGQLTQRKGISYLLDAVKMMGQSVRLTMIGTKAGDCKLLDAACVQHRWLETLPHHEVLAEMGQHDVFVFPSLFEGFGLTIGEALSQGLPVITTPNTGAPDIIQEGVEGFILPIRSVEAIAAKLRLLHEDRELLKYMSDAALAGGKRISWDQYGDAIAQAVSETIGVPCVTSGEKVDSGSGRVDLGPELIHGGMQVRR